MLTASQQNPNITCMLTPIVFATQVLIECKEHFSHVCLLSGFTSVEIDIERIIDFVVQLFALGVINLMFTDILPPKI